MKVLLTNCPDHHVVREDNPQNYQRDLESSYITDREGGHGTVFAQADLTKKAPGWLPVRKRSPPKRWFPSRSVGTQVLISVLHQVVVA